MTKKEKANAAAKSAVVREWDAWAATQSDDTKNLAGGMLFFNYLQKERRDLLEFRTSSNDKWQVVHGWLIQESRVKD